MQIFFSTSAEFVLLPHQIFPRLLSTVRFFNNLRFWLWLSLPENSNAFYSKLPWLHSSILSFVSPLGSISRYRILSDRRLLRSSSLLLALGVPSSELLLISPFDGSFSIWAHFPIREVIAGIIPVPLSCTRASPLYESYSIPGRFTSCPRPLLVC